jgi:hypothetical protein
MNLRATTSLSATPLRVTLVLESLSNGRISASILELPYCRVEADTKEAAIAQIRSDAAALLNRLELVSLEIPVPRQARSESPWIKYAGMFENDPDFAEIAAAIRSERESDDDSDVDPSVYSIEG